MHNVASVLYFVDAEKAFDRVKWDFIRKVLEAMKVGPFILTWFSLIYMEQEIVINMEDHNSGKFKIHRGVWQVCPLFQLLFNWAIEILAIMVRSDSEVRVISVPSIGHKIALYADDAVFFLIDLVCSKRVLSNVLESYTQISGYKVNKQKLILMDL